MIRSSLIVFAAAFAGLACSSRGDTTYVVRKNDTLSEIAQQHHLSVAALANRNRIREPNRIFVGQKLIIPGGRSQLPPDLKDALDKTNIAAGRWKHIVVHHSGSESGSVAIFDRYHREERRMENGLAYHFVIGNGRGMGDGEIGVGNRWVKQLDGGHLASLPLNRTSLGICLVGNFDEDYPSERQMESLQALTEYLMSRCQLSVKAVQTHQSINTVFTRCPGRNFPSKSFIRELSE